MSSPIDICNRALSEIGTRSTMAAFEEGSAESIQCSLWYDNQRQVLLRAAPWGFARAQAPMTQLGSFANNTALYPWPYKFLYPSEALRLHYTLPPPPTTTGVPLESLGGWCGPSRDRRFIIANDKDEFNRQRKVVLATQQDAWGVFTINVTDTSLFDPSFENALQALISYRLCIPLTGNAGMRSEFKAAVVDAITGARAADGNEAIPTTDHTPDWIAVRGVGDVGPFGGALNLGNWYLGWDDISWGM